MLGHSVKCEAFEVNTESGICHGLAKIQKGETFILGTRTPESKGICSSALTAIHP